MRTILTMLFLAMLLPTSYAQSYQDLVKKAFKFLEEQDEKRFEETYLRLFSAYAKEQEPSYMEACAAVARGDKAQAFELLEKLVEEASFLDEMKADPAFKELHRDSRWQSLIRKIKQVEKGYDNRTRRELEAIHASDQGIRLLVLEAYQAYGKESKEAQSVRSCMKKIDAVNAQRIQALLQEKGWLGSKEVGELGNQAYFLAIQHVEDAVVQELYLPVLHAAMKQGKAAPWQYAFLQDRILMNQGKPQIYGTQKIVSDDPDSSYVIPLQEPEIVDSLRADVGLGPLKEALEAEGMTWDLEEYKRRLPHIQQMYRVRYLKKLGEKPE